MTVLLTCSAAGEKLKPLLIGKSLKPRCFKGIDKAALPVTYRANRKAWMTSVRFKEWLNKLMIFAYDELLGVVSWADYISMDDSSSTTNVASDEWEAALIAKTRGEVPADDSSSDEDAEEPAEPTPVLTTREALVRVNELVTFAIRASDTAMLEAVTKVQNMVEDHCIKQAAVAKQKSIRDFFSAQ